MIPALAACELPGTPVATTQPRIHPSNPKPGWPSGSYATPATVEVKLCVDITGVVTSRQMTRSSGQKDFDRIMVDWVQTARFIPATADGRPFEQCEWRYAYTWSGKRPGG